METQRICPNCRKPLPPDVPMGLCPECLVQSGFPTESAAESAAARFVPPPVEEIARLFPHLEIHGLIGRGGMGAVYKARQPALDRFVALKVLPPSAAGDPGFAERFNREARTLARLNHPNIVAVHDYGKAGALPYLLMEYVDGTNLRAVECAGKLSPEQALAIVPQICAALQFAHSEGIVHRDIKPENLLLDRKGQVKITDFGIAKIVGLTGGKTALTGVKDVVGTPHYMAPEQIEKPQAVDHRADIYSLGVVFYEMLTGELPLGKFAPPSRKVTVDVRLDEVVLHALEKEPSRRYQQASQVKTDVETIAGTPPPAAGFAAGGQGVPPAAPASPAAPGKAPAANGMITAPAVGLMVAAAWKLFSVVTGLVFLAGFGNRWFPPGLLHGFGIGSFAGLASVSMVLFKLIPAVLIFFGAFQMLRLRSYAWAMAAAILAIVACSLVGLPMGIWALIVLARPDVRQAFEANRLQLRPVPSQPGRRGSIGKIVLVAAAFVLLVVVACGTLFGMGLVHYLKSMDSPPDRFHRNIRLHFPLARTGSFSIDNVDGRIEITGWDQNDVAIQGTVQGRTQEEVDAVRTDVDSDTNRLVVHTRQPSKRTGFLDRLLWFRNGAGERVDYVIHVPRDASLAGITSSSGSITVQGVSGDIEATSANGRMQVTGAAGDVKLSTVNGRISLELVSLGPGRTISLNSVNGRIEATLPPNADAEVSAHTVNGGMSCDFPALTVDKEFPTGRRLHGTLGQGGARVNIRSENGRINLRKGGELQMLQPVRSGADNAVIVYPWPSRPASICGYACF